MKQYILAHDLGTSGNKATLFDEKGKLISSYVSPYDIHIFNGNWAEQDPQIWWDAVCKSTNEVVKSIDRKSVVAISFSAQMMGCLCVDNKGKPLHNSLLYCDQRSKLQEEELIEKVGFENIFRITGHRPSCSYSLTKLMWIRDNLPEVYKKTYKILQAKDYINFLLTGKFYTDFNDASGTNAFDINEFTWSNEILDAVDISIDKFPQAVESSSYIGTLTDYASQKLNLPTSVKIIVGSGDGGCASLGAKSIEKYTPYCYLGSSSWVSVTSEKVLDDDRKIGFTWAHPIKGFYQPCATMQTAGSSISWFAKTFMGEASGKNLNKMNDLANMSPIGSNNLFFLPYLMGERSPWWNPKAKGSFIGINLSTSFNDYCRAVFEGVAMNLYINFEQMKVQIPDRTIVLIGGGVLNTSLVQIIADVFGCKVEIPKFLTEATSMGAAVLAGVGSGVYSDFSVINEMNPIDYFIEPNMEANVIYKEKMEKFKKAYLSLDNWF